MRPLLLGCTTALLAVSAASAGCSHGPPAPAPAPTPVPAARAAQSSTTTSATLRLAAAIGDVDGGVEKAPPVSLAGKTVLHVGDSMVGGNWGLTRALEAKFTAEGATFVHDYKVSESIVSYDHSPKLKSLIDKHHPDIVIITLGTNDVFVPYPASMASHVRSIVKRVGAAECYWMGPPTWKPDTGIVQVLKDNVAPCKFFDSSHLKLQRSGDGIHPTDCGGAAWAASFWTFFRSPPTSL